MLFKLVKGLVEAHVYLNNLANNSMREQTGSDKRHHLLYRASRAVSHANIRQINLISSMDYRNMKNGGPLSVVQETFSGERHVNSGDILRIIRNATAQNVPEADREKDFNIVELTFKVSFNQNRPQIELIILIGFDPTALNVMMQALARRLEHQHPDIRHSDRAQITRDILRGIRKYRWGCYYAGRHINSSLVPASTGRHESIFTHSHKHSTDGIINVGVWVARRHFENFGAREFFPVAKELLPLDGRVATKADRLVGVLSDRFPRYHIGALVVNRRNRTTPMRNRAIHYGIRLYRTIQGRRYVHANEVYHIWMSEPRRGSRRGR